MKTKYFNIFFYLLPLFFIISLGANATSFEAAVSALFGITSSTPPLESTGVLNIASSVFDEFYKGLNQWMWSYSYSNTHTDVNHIGIYTKLANAILPIFWLLVQLMMVLGFVVFLYTSLTEAGKKIINLIVYIFFAAIFLESSIFFKEWLFEPMIDFLIGIMMLLLGNEANILASQSIGIAIFGGVEKEFDKIFNLIGLMWEDVGWTEIKALFVIILLTLTYAGLYAIFSILIFIGFFGFYVMMAMLPLVLLFAMVSRQFLSSWFKTTLNYFLIPIMTAFVMSITLLFLDNSITSLTDAKDYISNGEIFTAAIGMALFVGILSIGMHWKAPELAAGLTGGIVSGAGSVVGTAAAVAGGSWVITRGIAGGGANAISGWRGGSYGNKSSLSYQASQDFRAKMLKGGEDF